MNCTRRKPMPSAWANERAVSVLPTPGTSSSRTWPRARMPGQHEAQRLVLADDGLADPVEDRGGDAGALVDRRRADVGRHGGARQSWESLDRRDRPARCRLPSPPRRLGEHAPGVVAEQLACLVGVLGGVDAVVALEAVGREVGEQGAGGAGSTSASSMLRRSSVSSAAMRGSTPGASGAAGRATASTLRRSTSPSRRRATVAIGAAGRPSARMYSTRGDHPARTMPTSVTHDEHGGRRCRWRTTIAPHVPLAHRRSMATPIVCKRGDGDGAVGLAERVAGVAGRAVAARAAGRRPLGDVEAVEHAHGQLGRRLRREPGDAAAGGGLLEAHPAGDDASSTGPPPSVVEPLVDGLGQLRGSARRVRRHGGRGRRRSRLRADAARRGRRSRARRASDRARRSRAARRRCASSSTTSASTGRSLLGVGRLVAPSVVAVESRRRSLGSQRHAIDPSTASATGPPARGDGDRRRRPRTATRHERSRGQPDGDWPPRRPRPWAEATEAAALGAPIAWLGRGAAELRRAHVRVPDERARLRAHRRPARGRRPGRRPVELDDADVVVLNTCCIRENADNKLYGNLGHLKTWKAQRDGRQIVVSGCLAQKDRDARAPAGRATSTS